MRLFVAIELNRKMKSRLVQIQEDMRWQGIEGNYTSEENLHLTLAFIGEYSDAEKVKDIIEGIDFEPFDISLSKMGSFSRLWWMGVTGEDKLKALAKKVRHALADGGIPFDKSKFLPHITLVRKPEGNLRGSLDTMKMPKMTVNEITLFRSDRGKHGMVYTRI